jgi:hypothetical protein
MQGEIERLMQHIDAEIQAANNALYGFAQGGAKHAFEEVKSLYLAIFSEEKR